MAMLEQEVSAPLIPPAPQAAVDLAWRDLGAVFQAGWRDFLAMPRFGLFFGGVYVLAGLAIGWATISGGNLSWLIPAIAGFPLVAPFVAVGLYEASRRRAIGAPLTWRAVLGALKGHGDDQILSMGVIVFVAFSFWMIVAHAIFAVFVGESAHRDHHQPQGGARQFRGDAGLGGGDCGRAVRGDAAGVPRVDGRPAGAGPRDLAPLQASRHLERRAASASASALRTRSHPRRASDRPSSPLSGVQPPFGPCSKPPFVIRVSPAAQ